MMNRGIRYIVRLLVALLTGGIMWCLVQIAVNYPSASSGRVRTDREQRRALYEVAYALDQYRKDNGHYPPAWRLDEEGNRMHSWRALILPHYLDDMYDWVQYDYDQPWDSPNNVATEFATAIGVEDYEGDTPYHQATKEIVGWKETSVFALITPDSIWVDEPGGKVPLVDTLLIMEGDKVVHWAAPYDIELHFDDEKRPNDVPRITPKLKGLGIFTDISKPDSGFKVEVREYEVETVDELIQLANASRPAEPEDSSPPQ